MDFNAVLAVDDPSALTLVKQPGSDGFRMDSTPLFQVFMMGYGNLNDFIDQSVKHMKSWAPKHYKSFFFKSCFYVIMFFYCVT